MCFIHNERDAEFMTYLRRRGDIRNSPKIRGRDNEDCRDVGVVLYMYVCVSCARLCVYVCIRNNWGRQWGPPRRRRGAVGRVCMCVMRTFMSIYVYTKYLGEAMRTAATPVWWCRARLHVCHAHVYVCMHVYTNYVGGTMGTACMSAFVHKSISACMHA